MKPRARNRKDGTFATVSEWAERHGFQWFTEGTRKELFMKDKDITDTRQDKRECLLKARVPVVGTAF